MSGAFSTQLEAAIEPAIALIAASTRYPHAARPQRESDSHRIPKTMAGEERLVGRGSVVFIPRGTPHSFLVVSELAHILYMQTPASGQAFYREASEALGEQDGPVDIAKLKQAALATGTTELLAPPPFRPTP